jgi:hypothetical protein
VITPGATADEIGSSASYGRSMALRASDRDVTDWGFRRQSADALSRPATVDT